MLLKARALIQLKVSMAVKFTSEIFVLGFVDARKLYFGELLFMFLSSISQICCIAYGHVV